MSLEPLVSPEMTSRELTRNLRSGLSQCKEVMPESLAWHTYIELSRRGHDSANRMFISALKSLHQRRSMAGSTLPCNDELTDEHRMTDDTLLSELWRAYKKCIRSNRTGPAAELLREIAECIEA